MSVRGASAAALAVIAVTLVFGCGDMSRDEMDRGIETIESIAAEGRLIAGQTAQDRIKTTFVRVRSRELTEEVDHQAEKLADATPAEGLARKRNDAVALSAKVSDALGTLQTFPEDEARAKEAEAQLRAAGTAISELLGPR